MYKKVSKSDKENPNVLIAVGKTAYIGVNKGGKKNRSDVAGARGVEPRPSGLEADVLPLYYATIL